MQGGGAYTHWRANTPSFLLVMFSEGNLT